jgi:hypothetical protein
VQRLGGSISKQLETKQATNYILDSLQILIMTIIRHNGLVPTNGKDNQIVFDIKSKIHAMHKCYMKISYSKLFLNKHQSMFWTKLCKPPIT